MAETLDAVTKCYRVNNTNVSLTRFDLQFHAQDPDKTEEATPRRKQEARKKGQVAKSPELSTVVVLLSLFVILNYFGQWLMRELQGFMGNNLGPAMINEELTETNLGHILLSNGFFFFRLFLPIGLGAMGVGLLINYLQVGSLFSLEPLKPKFSRINPLNGLKRMFSSHGLVELVKSVIKLAIVGYFVYSTIRDRLQLLINMVKQTPLQSAGLVWDILFQIALKVCIFLLILAVFDYAYQRYQLRKSLRMSKREIKEEFKQTEGNPQIKAKIRQRQRQIATRRMMQEVPKAAVVITNPTHLAVALKYEPKESSAPVVIAKGADFLAQKIKEVALAHDITLVENKHLAQALYKTVEIGEMIPAGLYQTVAEVLAFVYRLKRKHA